MAKKRKKKRPLYVRILTNRKVIGFLVVVTGIILFSVWVPNFFAKADSIDSMRVDVLTKDEEKALKKYPNAYHTEIGKTYGIKNPLKSKDELIKNASFYISEYNLQKIDDTKYYEVQGLIHSLPYLKKDACNFLDELGERFQNTLKELGLRTYRFSITSVLRTLDTQSKLRKTNVNATNNNSSHYYGLSFDLSQTCFFETGNSKPIYTYRLRNLLLRDLIKMQEEGKCYVLLEKQTKCIHITVRVKK